MSYRRVASLKTFADFETYSASVGAELPAVESLSPAGASPLAQPMDVGGVRVGNRFCILPMEGWDGTPEGRPSEHTRRRWTRFGLSGAKLIWGGEAVAVEHDGRANPNQLLLNDQTLGDIEGLRLTLEKAHAERFESTDDLYVGLQLTHSGRFARPDADHKLKPQVMYRHPVLEAKYGNPEVHILTDDEMDSLVGKFVASARLAQRAGYRFVDIKHCHGYLGHEMLSAVDRPGRYGGSFENRTRFLRDVVAGIRAEAPGLEVGVRLSAVDWAPFEKGADAVGVPCPAATRDYRYAFGGDGTGQGFNYDEPVRMLQLLEELGIAMVCITVGSPYYNPHIQRPAYFPPSDGYLPPEDPLCGVARQIAVVAELKRRVPGLSYIGSGYSYLQEWLPNVAEAVVAQGMVDSVGLGRMVLSYPELPADVLGGVTMQRKLICRTFSDCTTAPRNHMISGCFPLDAYYKEMPLAAELTKLKAEVVEKHK